MQRSSQILVLYLLSPLPIPWDHLGILDVEGACPTTYEAKGNVTDFSPVQPSLLLHSGTQTRVSVRLCNNSVSVY